MPNINSSGQYSIGSLLGYVFLAAIATQGILNAWPDHLAIPWVICLTALIWHSARQTIFLFQGRHLPFPPDSGARYCWLICRMTAAVLLTLAVANPGNIASQPMNWNWYDGFKKLASAAEVKNKVVVGYGSHLLAIFGLLLAIIPLWRWAPKNRAFIKQHDLRHSVGLWFAGFVGLSILMLVAMDSQFLSSLIYISVTGQETAMSQPVLVERQLPRLPLNEIHHRLFNRTATQAIAALGMIVSLLNWDRVLGYVRLILSLGWILCFAFCLTQTYPIYFGDSDDPVVNQLTGHLSDALGVPTGTGLIVFCILIAFSGLISTAALGQRTHNCQPLDQAKLAYFSPPGWLLCLILGTLTTMIVSVYWYLLFGTIRWDIFSSSTRSPLRTAMELPFNNTSAAAYLFAISLMLVQASNLNHWTRRNIKRNPVCGFSSLPTMGFKWAAYSLTIVIVAISCGWFGFAAIINTSTPFPAAVIERVSEFTISKENSLYRLGTGAGIAAIGILVFRLFAKSKPD